MDKSVWSIDFVSVQSDSQFTYVTIALYKYGRREKFFLSEVGYTIWFRFSDGTYSIILNGDGI